MQKQKWKASMTVEAAMALPLFIVAILTIYSVFSMLRFYGGLESELAKQAQKVAVYSAASEIMNGDSSGESAGRANLGDDNTGVAVAGIAQSVLANGYVEGQIKKKIPLEELKKVGIASYGSLHYKTSFLNTSSSVIDIAISYEMRPFLKLIPVSTVSVINRARVKSWTGYDGGFTKEEEEERYVYVAENGTVYHLTETCTHINLTIIPVSKEYVQEVISGDRHRYSTCEICGVGTDSVVYVTDSGDRIHSSLNCSSLRRTVQRVPLSQCEGMPCCSRCGGSGH